jgi:hypothetical protein
MIKIFDHIILLENISKIGLCAGDVGIVCMLFEDGYLGVQFMNWHCEVLTKFKLQPSQVRKVNPSDICHARTTHYAAPSSDADLPASPPIGPNPPLSAAAIPFVNPHWAVFAGTKHIPAGKIGFKPEEWAKTHGTTLPPLSPALPTYKLTRSHVMEICREPSNPVLFGYICAMAWGSQGSGPGGGRHLISAWSDKTKIEAILLKLRAGGLTRCQAYNLFLGKGNIPGLGPAYFTKLLYFFSPEENFYIMDQWTAKSINLLTGRKVVRLTGDYVAINNTCGNYEAYCEEVDAIAGHLSQSGENIEEMLMSKGGKRPWPWRCHVKSTSQPSSRYSSTLNQKNYSKTIKNSCFK